MAKHRIQPISGIVILSLLALGCGYGIYAMARVSEPAQINLRTVNRDIVANTDNSGEPGIYANSTYGIQLAQPAGWKGVETTPIGIPDAMLTVTFTDPLTNNRLIFSIFKPAVINTLRNSLSITSESKTMLGTLSADKWVGEDLKDGSPVTIITAEQRGRLYEVTSYAPESTLDSFLSAFKIVQ